jgi:hypothetical protein
MTITSEPVPTCPICGGMVRRELLLRKRPEDPEWGPWTCDLHGKVTPHWEDVEEEEEYEDA